MLARVKDPSTRVIYAAALVVSVGYGVSVALTALRLNAIGYGKPAIGSLAAVFASGIVAASLPMAAIVKRFSAKTVLVVSLAGYAVCVGLFPFLESASAIAAVRFFDGACSVATWVCFEIVLLRRAEAFQKAYVMSLYGIAVGLGYVVGPIAAKGIVGFASMQIAFLASSALALAACAVVVLRLDRAAAEKAIPNASHEGDKAGPARSLSLLDILWRIKTSLFATFSYGYFQASVVLFLPLFLIEKRGIPEARTILIPAFFAAGMLLFSNYAGRVGDRLGHLYVMRILGIIGAAMIASFALLRSWPLMCAAIFVAGATLASISPVSLALQGVVVDPASYGRANSLYNGVYAAGMLLGPPVSSLFFARLGGGAMLAYLAALWALFVVFSTVFWRDDPAAHRAGPSASTTATSPVAEP
jgi:MFS family permease